MAYYTIAHRIREIDPKLLTPEVFDYIFLDRKSPNLPEKKKLDAMREEFLYWYPYYFTVLGQGPHLQPLNLPDLPPRDYLRKG